jgi:hypothetical protein
MYTTIFIAALAGLATAASKPSSVTGYTNGVLPTLAPIRWSGELEKGGPIVNITGSHHEVTSRIKELAPWWHREGIYENATHEAVMNGSLHGYEPHEEYANSTIAKRSNRFNQVCDNIDYPWANYGREEQNVAYLTSHYGNGMCGVAANSCGRFSCSYNSAVLFCNNEPYEIAIPCPLLAQNHRFVLSYCSPSAGANGWDAVGKAYTGQAYYSNPQYNVIQKGTDPGKHC